MKRVLITLVIGTLLLASCASLNPIKKYNRPYFTKLITDTNRATVYFYRPNDVNGDGLFYDIYCNKKKLLPIHNSGYFFHYYDVGEYTFAAGTVPAMHYSDNSQGVLLKLGQDYVKENDRELEKKCVVEFTLKLNKGDVYFIKAEMIGKGPYARNMQIVSNETAIIEITNCRMITYKDEVIF